MHSLATILGAVTLSCAGSYLVVSLGAPAPSAPGPEKIAGPLEEGVRAELQRSLRDIQARLSRLESRSARGPDQAVEADAIRRAVAAWLQAHPSQAKGKATEASAKAPFNYTTALARLRDGALPWEEQMALWSQVAEAGLMDKMVAAFEQRAKDNPRNADVQTQLGMAYIQKLQRTSDFVEKGQLALKADRVFDRALELDADNWGARFAKATSLSFWPPIMGKGPEAMRQFEILIGKQNASGQRRPEYAQSYIYLGNLYEQQGDTEKARRIRQQGYDLFPHDQALKKSLAK